MSWDNTYTHNLAVAVDFFSASLFWNRADVTVSSLCGLQLRRRAQGEGFQAGLVALGDFLEWINPGHCEAAIKADFARMEVASQLMGYWVDPEGVHHTLVST